MHCKRCGKSPAHFELFDRLCAEDMAKFVFWENTLKIAQEFASGLSGGAYEIQAREAIDLRGHYPNSDGKGRFQLLADGEVLVNDSLDLLMDRAQQLSNRLVESTL